MLVSWEIMAGAHLFVHCLLLFSSKAEGLHVEQANQLRDCSKITVSKLEKRLST